MGALLIPALGSGGSRVVVAGAIAALLVVAAAGCGPCLRRSGRGRDAGGRGSWIRGADRAPSARVRRAGRSAPAAHRARLVGRWHVRDRRGGVRQVGIGALRAALSGTAAAAILTAVAGLLGSTTRSNSADVAAIVLPVVLLLAYLVPSMGAKLAGIRILP